MNIQLKWYYRLGFLLLLFIITFIFIKLKPIWAPVLETVLTVLTPFIIGAFITYLLHPVVEKLHEGNLPRWLAILIIYILFFGGIGFAMYKGIPALIHQLKDLAENIPSFVNQYRSWIYLIQEQTSTWPDGVQGKIEDWINYAEKALEQLLSNVLDGFVGILNSIVAIAFIPFIAFYMLKDIEKIKKAAWYLTPRKWRKNGIQFLREVDKSLGSYIRGQLFVCVLIGAISALLFWIIKMKYPLLLGLIAGLTNIIPYFGPIIGLFPAVIIAATISLKMVLFIIVIGFVLQFLEGNILSPLIVGKSLRMHPLIIMFALYAGGEIGGILGLILAVPVFAILKVSIIHARNNFTGTRMNND